MRELLLPGVVFGLFGFKRVELLEIRFAVGVIVAELQDHIVNSAANRLDRIYGTIVVVAGKLPGLRRARKRNEQNGKRPYGTDVKGEFLEKTAPVGSYAANPWGLCDMHGNVWEWCVDWFDYYPSNAVTDPCPIHGTTRLMRDGGWYNSAKDCRSANRFYYVAVYWNADVGFRLTLVPKNE